MTRIPLWLLVVAGVVQAQTQVFDGQLDGGGDFEMIPIVVPAGTVEISIAHPAQQVGTILDYGLWDPTGFRGYGGGNSEPFVVGEFAASRSYLPGPILPGTWGVMIGKAKVPQPPARYRLEVEFRTTATLAPQSRAELSPVELSADARWYAGDFHVHSAESGDARPSLDAVATFAVSRGLDFVEFSEHNTSAHVGLLEGAQGRHPTVLLVPGVEFTTYKGHANGIGAVRYVDHRLGLGGVTIDTAFAALREQGAIVSINHPLLDLGDACIGCKWEHRIPRDLQAVEIATGGWDKTGVFFTKDTIAWWERLVSQGLRAAPIGGSDDHEGGVGSGAFYSPIGSPTTMVFSRGLSVAALLEGVRGGHTVVKLQGPGDPMIDLRIGDGMAGDEVIVSDGEIVATVTGGDGSTFILWRDGKEYARVEVVGDSFEHRQPLTESGRYRGEIQIGGEPRTITNNVWVSLVARPAGCGCGSGGEVLLLIAVALLRRKLARSSLSPREGRGLGRGAI